jgi:hypothetical protein
MNKHFIANKYLPIALALAAFTAAGTAPVFASARNAQPLVHKQSINRSGYSAHARITDYGAAVPSSVGRPDPFGVNGWFNR